MINKNIAKYRLYYINENTTNKKKCIEEIVGNGV
jgi:hypothetical protein